jgi:hypothetical protein
VYAVIVIKLIAKCTNILINTYNIELIFVKSPLKYILKEYLFNVTC